MEVKKLPFVNRDEELQRIQDAIKILQDEQRLLRTPIFEFRGVQGIGKTTLLQQVKNMCDHENLLCFLQEASSIVNQDFNELETRLRKEPAALLLDTLEALNSEQLQLVETRLSKLVENSRLLVILASRKEQSFDRSPVISRKIRVFRLTSLKSEICVSSLDLFFADILSDHARKTILDWTQGYPLAMSFMTRTIQEKKLDLSREPDRERMLRLLIQEVIENELLGNVPPEEKTRLHTILMLLSVPRRFNLILTQDLIDKFAWEHRLPNSLAYITIPTTINDATSVLDWSLERAGYCIDSSIRNLFLLQYKFEQPEKYKDIHKFLAQKNADLAQKVTSSERTRYLREFFYHLACSEDETKVRAELSMHVRQLTRTETPDGPDLLSAIESNLQFYEEFQRDEELQEALGRSNVTFTFTLIHRNFLDVYQEISSGDERGKWLKAFLSLVSQKRENDSPSLIYEEAMRLIIKQVSREDAAKLYYALSQDAELKNWLGGDFDGAKDKIHTELLQ